MKPKGPGWIVPGLAVAALLTAAAVTPTGAGAADAAPAPPSPEVQKILTDVCSNCHDISITTDLRKTREEWENTVGRMISNGAALSDQQAALVVDYLAKAYAPPGK